MITPSAPDAAPVPRPVFSRLAVLLIAMLTLAGIAAVAVTNALDPGYLGAFAPHRSRIMAAEVAIFSILIIELAGKAIINRFRAENAVHMGITVRALLRVVAYLILAVSIVSMLAANPALAVGVGGVTGVAVAFSAQSIIANAFAGVFLAISRPFRINQEITVMGNTGRVLDIRLIHTVIDAGERLVYVPNSAMMTQAIQRKKDLPPVPAPEAVEEDDSEALDGASPAGVTGSAERRPRSRPARHRARRR